MKYATVNRSWRWIGSLGVLLLSTITTPASAAEQIFAQYSFLELSIPVADLEAYAKKGQLSETLKVYADYLPPEQLQTLRSLLSTRLNVPPKTLTSLLSTPVGETLLARASTIIQSKSKGASPEALSTALVTAAADPEGLTLISLMRHFPDVGIQVDVTEGIALFQSVEQLLEQTNAAVTLVQQKSQTEPPKSSAGSTTLKGLQQPGPFAWTPLMLKLKDTTPRRLQLTGKARTFPVDLYLPKRSDPAPVIVISHGFSSDRSAFVSFAKHLVSHGFAVAVPEHPGSSAKRTQAWLAGKIKEPSQSLEFLDRPLDITFLLDDLAKRSATNPRLQNRFNLDQVGVMGHSFGGYTALAVGGGQLNFTALRQDCGPQIQQTLNVSQILQCEALGLPQKDYALTDSRVKAVLAVNPITRSIFGEQGLRQVQTPVMVVSASMDTIAPSLLEQIQPFTWLPESQKYLAVIQSASHFSTVDKRQANRTIWKLPTSLVGPTPAVARGYLRGLGTAFFQKHLLGKTGMPLSSEAAAQLSQPSLPLSLVQQLSNQDLQPVLKQAASAP